MPQTRGPTYARFVCEVCPQKSEKEQTRLTVGGNLINYPDPVTTRMCDLVTFKMYINSTLSRIKRKYFSFDVNTFYLNTPMERSEYMENSARPHPRRNHCLVCVKKQSPQLWRDLHRNTNGNVWVAASWYVGQQIIETSTRQARVL